MSGTAALHQQATETGRVWLTRGQVALRAFGLGLPAALLLVLLAVDYQRTSLLFRDPLGQKMLTAAGALLVVGLGLHLPACVALNRVAPPGNDGLRARRMVLSFLLEGTHFLFFCLPAVFVLLVGPAAVTITRTLAQP